jgi:muramoyltetrapeptide carboxypeptidase
MVRARREPPAPPAGTAGRVQAPPLAPGDGVALFSPSSHSGRDGAAQFEHAQAILESWGLRPRALPAEQARHLYLAGSDAERAAEFQRLYCDAGIKGLFATRGGYGAARMLPHLDGTRIAAAGPKAVVGMSDVVALFAYLDTVAGVGAVHGPCLAAPGSVSSPQEAENLRDLQELLFRPESPATHPCALLHSGTGARRQGGGTAAGRLVGGNLAVLTSLLGTPWALETEGCLLFLEDVNEQPYRIDRLLTQLRQAGRLDGVAGVIFGHLRDCDSEPPGLLRDVLRDVFRAAPYPVATGLVAGHGERNRALPLGRLARLAWDAEGEGAAARLVLD